MASARHSSISKFYLSIRRGVLFHENQLEHNYSIWRIMKLTTPLNIIKNALSDISAMHDFTYKVPNETRDEFWDKECINHPTASNCKVYEA